MADYFLNLNHDKIKNLFDKFFQTSPEDHSLIFNPTSLTKEDIGLLLSWTDVITTSLYNNSGNIQKKLKEIRTNTLRNNTELNDELFWVIEKIAGVIYFLFNKKPANIDHLIAEDSIFKDLVFKNLIADDLIIKNLIYSIGQSFILCCILIKYLDAKEESICITLDDIREIVSPYMPDDLIDFNMKCFYITWLQLLQIEICKDVSRFLEKDNKDSIFSNLVTIPSTHLTMYQYSLPQCESLVGIIETNANSSLSNEILKNSDSFGFGLNISALYNLPFNLWIMDYREKKDTDNEYTHYEGYWFDTEDTDNILKQLLIGIFFSIRMSVTSAEKLIDYWNELIENPSEMFVSDRTWIKNIIKSPDSAKAFLDFNKLRDTIHSLRSLQFFCFSLLINILDKFLTMQLQALVSNKYIIVPL
ncbi:MAG: hypothetical protein HQK76_18135 [Desulfobacterales bacterium]|nr:hypothetical protein [Desulfobacterales bacterium]